MKLKILLVFILLVGCTRGQNSEVDQQPTQAQNLNGQPNNPANEEPPADDELVIPFIPGLIIRHNPQPKKTGSFYYMDDLKIIDQKSGAVMAEFPEQIWGSVPVQVREKSIIVMFADEEGSEFEYKVTLDASGKLTESSRCYFYDGNKKDRAYEIVIPSSSEDPADWEAVVSKLSRLARLGNPQAYKFFMEPTPDQRKYHKYNDGAASFKSIQTILAFMKKNGCKWE